MRTARVRTGVIAGLAVMAMAAAACGSSSPSASTGGDAATTGGAAPSSVATPPSSAVAPSGSAAPSGPVDAKTATSAADFGGMDALVAAAKKEGQLNVIALPPDWANYGEVIKTFGDKYGITVNSQAPDDSSAQEIQAADTNKGTDKAPDVFDLGSAVALTSTDHFAPYQVQAWKDIPDVNKEPTGLWVDDYTGVMAVGYDATSYPFVKTLDDLKNPKLKGTVALNGNPTQAGAAFAGVVMAALSNGGSADDISKGVDYFKSLKDAGTLSKLDPKDATVVSGQTGVVIDWSYNQHSFAALMKKQGGEWKSFVPQGADVGSYYNQAINKDAPHPAAARLWEEFLYTPEAQNLWIKGGAVPVLYDVMKKAGTLDSAVQSNLPEITGSLVELTKEQTDKANAYLKEHWAAEIGS